MSKFAGQLEFALNGGTGPLPQFDDIGDSDDDDGGGGGENASVEENGDALAPPQQQQQQLQVSVVCPAGSAAGQQVCGRVGVWACACVRACVVRGGLCACGGRCAYGLCGCVRRITHPTNQISKGSRR